LVDFIEAQVETAGVDPGASRGSAAGSRWTISAPGSAPTCI
jgi:hypothetical protein